MVHKISMVVPCTIGVGLVLAFSSKRTIALYNIQLTRIIIEVRTNIISW
jgi:hypothetical protein